MSAKTEAAKAAPARDGAKTSRSARASSQTLTNEATRELLDTISDAYARITRIAEEADSSVSVRVTTAVPLDKKLREKVQAKAEKLFEAPVYLNERVDPAIIGGIILEAPTRRFDASLRSQLASMRRSLIAQETGEDA